MADVCSGQRTSAAYYTSDDLESEIIAKLWRAGGFQWDLDRVRAYASGAVRLMLMSLTRAKIRPEADFCDAEGNVPSHFYGVSTSNPFRSCQASEAEALRVALPTRQCDALGILADGGTPIDVSNELGIPIVEAILLIKEARRNILLVAGEDDL